MRCCFGCVSAGSGGGFWRFVAPNLLDFAGSERTHISSSKLKAGKWFLESREGSRKVGQAALILVNDQSVHGIDVSPKFP